MHSHHHHCVVVAGGLNIEGKMVHSCLANGTACGQPAADAYCKYIGFDGSVQDQFQVVPSDEPTRAVSGGQPDLGLTALATAL